MQRNAVVSTFEQTESHSELIRDDITQASPITATGYYARDLRVLGQIVEGYSVSALHVKVFFDRYQICALQTTSNPDAHLFITRLLRPRSCNQKLAGKRKTMGGMVKCELSVQDIEAAEALYRKFRQNSQEVPAPYRMSQLLRGVGFFLDNKGAKLRTLLFENDNISLVYQDTEHKTITIDEHSAFFYEHWLEMSQQRGKGPKLRS